MTSTRRTSFGTAALVGLSFALGATRTVAQLRPPGAGAAARCVDGVISEVVVRSLDPYDESSASADARFGWAFRTLNRLHFETRREVIRWELLFEEGDCFDPLRLSESERALRSLRYLQSASVTSTRLDNGAHRVEVETRDSWAISASFGIDFEDGLEVSGVQASYRNVLGTGLRASFFRRAFRERLRYGVLTRHSNLFGTRVDAVVHGGQTRAGGYFSQTLQRPFLNEFADHAFRQVVARRDDYFGYSLPPELGFSPAYLRYRSDLVEFAYQQRVGLENQRQMVLGVGLSYESFSRAGGTEGARAVVEGDFAETVVAEPQVRDAIFAQATPHSTSRMTAYLGYRDVRYDVRGGLDAIDALQDLLVGSAFTMGLGPGVAVAGGADEDVLVRLQGRAGFLGQSTYLLARTDLHARRTFGGASAAAGWRDLVGSVRADGYWTQSDWASLYVRGRASGGWNTDRPFQLRLGGRESIRAYSEDAFPGGRLVFGSVEQRFTVEALSTSFADVGVAAFADAGRMWAGDAPFGRDSGWQAGVGAGLRISPDGGRRVFRADVMLPLTDLRDERGVALRLYGEVFGVLERRRWPDQVARSRWYGNDPDMSGRIADPLAGN